MASTPSAQGDRNLLYGILALQMDFISRDALIAAMNAWVLDKSKPLGAILVEQGQLVTEVHSVLDALVVKHIEQHQGDPQQSLAALRMPPAVQHDLEKFADPEVSASLAQVPRIIPNSLAEATTLPYSHEEESSNGRFDILRRHAWGGLGEVYVAEDRELHREVALKRLHERHADNKDSRARFLQEAEVTGGLEHPGIVPVYGLGTSGNGRPYYAMRFIRGQTLKEAIQQFYSGKPRTESERRIELRQLLTRFVAVCNAIEYAHSRGVIHRDIKPSNIMLGKYGETLVVDWGLAKALRQRSEHAPPDEHTLIPSSGSGSSETLPGSAIGTPAYMSPEQSEGRIDEIGPASDVYSLGATLYTILTGKEPFDYKHIEIILGKVQSGDFIPPRERNPSVPRVLDAICLKAMSLLPKDRYPSCTALASDIEHWLADEPVTALRDPLSDRLIRWIKRHRVPATAGAALVIATLVGLLIGTTLLGRANSQIKAAITEAQKQRDDATAQRTTAEHQRNLAEVATQEALRAANLGAQEASLIEKVLPRIFRADNDHTLRNEISETQKPIAEADYQLNQLQVILTGGDKSRTQLAPQWRGMMDLALGRVLAVRTRLMSYNLRLAEMKVLPRRFSTSGNNTWRLVRASVETRSGRLQRSAKQARDLLERVIQEQPGTDFERSAREELKLPMGWDWEELHINYPSSTAVPSRPGN